ncbi:TetR/AcrR family transcriptional regulator [Embleya sp. NPDC020630]|uniref:TetR/AcrR family transcriptional regulator n=1 Tax=Embleya sp. NPDC020630 TaxID=3363979 RepID=UPI0037B29C31
MAEPRTESTITLTRSLTRDQQARRERLVRAACDLALEGGYAAVTMHDVADRAGVARATVYRYFTSKNHLLSEVSALWIGELSDELARRPLPADPAGRLAALLCRIVEVSAENRLLTEAVVQAATAPDPSAGQSQENFHQSIHRITGLAFGEPGEDVDGAAAARRHDIETVLGHVLLSGLVSLTARGRALDEVQDLMRTAVRLFVPLDT